MTTPHDAAARRSIRRHVLAGIIAVILLVGGIGAWAMTTELLGAVIAAGLVVVESNVKKVQHPTGGVVSELNVHQGALVKAGDILIRLDETQTRANLAIIVRSLDELAAREARAEAERDDAEAIAFPADLLERALSDPEVARVVDGERKLFETRRTAREGQKAQLRERVSQLREEIRGLVAQEEAKVQQIEWIGKELEGVRDLWNKNLVPFTRVTALERDAARLRGERGQAIAQIAQSKGRISEIELQELQIDQNMRTEVGRDLADIRAKASELRERKVAAEDQMKRVDIRAPQDGFVHQLAVHTVGGVVTQGETLMLIVPATDQLMIDVKVMPQDIDQVRLDQRAVVRFSAFNQRTTPEINGVVTRISADISEDQRTGLLYYLLRVGIPQSELIRLGNLKLVPGMPVEVFIQTQPRTVMTYLTRPLADQLFRTFREK